MAYLGETGSYPSSLEELEEYNEAMRQARRDTGVAGLRALTRFTGIADIPAAGKWLGREAYGTQGLTGLLEQSDRMHGGGAEGSAASYLNNVYLRSMGVLGDEKSIKKAKKLINPSREEYHAQVEDTIDAIVPLDTNEQTRVAEFWIEMTGLGWGAVALTQLVKMALTKGVPWLLTKMKSIVKKKQGEEILEDIVPEASLQIEHKPVPEARIDKTVERAVGDIPDDPYPDMEFAFEKAKFTPGYDRPTTRPKTAEEVNQKWKQKLEEAEREYYEEAMDIVKQKEKGKPFSEIIDEGEALNRRTEKRAAEMKKQMAEDFDYLEELALDEKLKTTPEHFQGMKETKYSNYTVKMLGDETNKLHRGVEKKLGKSLEEAKKAGQEALEKAQAKLKKAKNEAEMDTIMAEFDAELNRIDEMKAVKDKEIDALYREEYNKIKDALNSIGREMDLLESGAVTRHSRGGLVENKVNYALNQWK